MSSVSKKHLTRLQIGIFVSFVTILLVAAYLFFQPYFSPEPEQEVQVASPQAEVAEKKYIEADRIATYGTYEQGMEVLNNALSSLKTNTDRSEMILRKSVLASNHAKPDDALKFAQEAEKLYPTRSSALRVAQTAEKLSNKKLAIEYYKLVIKRTTATEQKRTPYESDDYRQKIKDLSAS